MSKRSMATGIEDRPWVEGGIYVIDDEPGHTDPDIIQILCYLDEDDPVAETRVVYRVFALDKCFDEPVSRAEQWIKCLVMKRTFSIEGA